MEATRRELLAGAAASAGALLLGPRARAARLLFADDFARSPDWGWGGDWYNQRYRRYWRIEGNRAVFHLPAPANDLAYRPNPVVVLDHDVADIDLRVSLSTNNPSGRAGALVRLTGYSDFYAACLGPGAQLRLVRGRRNREEVLARVPLRLAPGRRMVVRLRAAGAGPVTLRAKAWLAGRPEPAWLIEVTDTSPQALLEPGAFGLVFGHALDGRSVTFKVARVAAHSPEKGRPSKARITYAIAGPPGERGDALTLVAKSALPSAIGFELGTEPTLTQGTLKVPYRRASAQAHTVRARIDLTRFQPGSFVYWRARSVRKGVRSQGPLSRFRVPPEPGTPIRFAFGSCTRWEQSPHHSFERSRLKLPDFYLHQGDFGYAMNKVVVHARDCYQDHWVRELTDPDLAALCTEVPFGMQRDDAEYGRNAADRRTHRPLTIGAHNELNANPRGNYFEFRYGDVAVFCIDCRRYSTGKDLPERKRSKLGRRQKRWLKERMKRAAADPAISLLVVSSPQSFGSDVSPASWRRGYPAEWEELIDFFAEGVGAPVLIVSGDAHGHRLHEYPQKDLPTTLPRIVEFTSSGTEQNKFFDSVDPTFLLKESKGSGFGVVELGAETISDGERVRSLRVTPYRTEDGSPFWSAEYVVVRGVGILPGP
jgi:phosphodiesterase/alkaline phosphatase D-like protein